jgi:hypothetical protein
VKREQGAPRLGLAAMLLATSTACGTTVPLASQTSSSQSGAAGVGGAKAPAAAGEQSGGSTGTTGGGTASDGGASQLARGVRGSGSSPGPVGAPATNTTSGAETLTSNRTPLTIGITYINNDSTSAALGESDTATTNGKSAAQAMVKGINAAGGLAGRVLRTVEYSWNSQTTNWSQDASVACTKFTQDNHVDVVLDGAFGTTGGFGDCLQKAGVLQITQGPEGDRVSSRSRALHANTGSMVEDRRYAAVVGNLAGTGYLSKSNQLGIIVEQCPPIERAYAKTIVPLIRSLGLKSPLERTIECTTSFSSAGPAASAISSAVLAFRQGGVDRVMFVSDFEDVVLLLFGNNADSQHYYPGYALSSGAQAALFSNIPKDQWPQLHGVGTSPQTDVADNSAIPSATEAHCLRLARTGGLTPANALDKAFVYGACGLFLLLGTALTQTDGNSNPRSLLTSIEGLGTSFLAPGLVAGRTRFSPGDHDGPDAVRVFRFVASCTCMRYSGQPLRAPD